MADARPTPRSRAARTAALLAAVLLAAGLAVPAGAAEPVARAVLFFSPSCPHCHTVLDEVLPPLFAEHGGPAEVLFDEGLPPEELAFYLLTNGRLEILVADVSREQGALLFYAATDAFGIASQGVPRLIAGDQVMIGSSDIPRRLPGIVSATMEAGEVLDWPSIPGVAEAVAATGDAAPTTTVPVVTTSTTTTTAPPATGTTEAGTPPATADPGTTSTTQAADPPATGDGGTTIPIVAGPSVWDRFRQDPAGNTVSVVVLLLMVAALIAAALRFREPSRHHLHRLIPVLAAAGLVVASYLAFVEVGDTEAVCGPVGDCNAVQSSEYSRLFGVLPIGLIGVAGYLIVIGAWAVNRFARRPIADWAAIALGAGAVAGTLLSVYLTFLEPFVIGATCMWCITSAVLITLLMWLSVDPAAGALRRIRTGGRGAATRTTSRKDETP